MSAAAETEWQKHPTWKPGDPQPRLSDGWRGVRIAHDGGYEVLAYERGEHGRALEILRWMAEGHIGTSSRTLALASVGLRPKGVFRSDAPHDAGDSGRCEFLAKMCPFVVEALPQLEVENPRWAQWADRIRAAARSDGSPA